MGGYAPQSDAKLSDAEGSLGTGARQSNKKRGQSLNHLLAFTLPPRAPPVAPRRSRRTEGFKPFNRERYVNAQYRFVLKPTFDGRRSLSDTDMPIPWQEIVQVLVPSSVDGMKGEHHAWESTQATTCPICLSPPTAPRMTRCGHVFCYACILHYLIVSENGSGGRGAMRHAKRCPICWDDVLAKDLKAVHWIDARHTGESHMAAFLAARQAEGARTMNDSDKASVLTLRLMERPHDAVVALPRSAHWPAPIGRGLLCTQPDASTYARFVLATPSFVVASLQADLACVQAAMSASHDTDELSREFLRVAQEELLAQLDVARAMPMPPTSPSSQAPSPGSYLYYQAASGQPMFLHPIDIKVLHAHFGAYTSFPDTLLVVAQHAEEGTVDEALRKKCKYLAHLPMSSDVTFVEVDWPRTTSLLSGIQDEVTWTPWGDMLKKRWQQRKDKAQREEKARKRAEKEAKASTSASTQATRTTEDNVLDDTHMSFREAAMIGAEMYFPIHPGIGVDEAEAFPRIPAPPPAPSGPAAAQPKTVWGTPAAASVHASTSQDVHHMDEAWNALEAQTQSTDEADRAQQRTSSRAKRKPKLILTGGGRGAL